MAGASLFQAVVGPVVPLADGAGTPADVGADTALLMGALLFGWLAYTRLRGRRFRTLAVALA